MFDMTIHLPTSNPEPRTCTIYFDIASFPSFCGGKILHGFNFRYNGLLTEKEHKLIADKFMMALLAKNSSELPSGVEFEGARELIVAKIFISDAVFGEDNDPAYMSAYTLGTLGSEWYSSGPMFNPNSGNMVEVFELNKEWTREEAVEMDNIEWEEGNYHE